MEAIEIKRPLPPFERESAIEKIRLAEDAWNARDPQRVVLVYTPNTVSRNRTEFLHGRDEVSAFLRRKVGERTRLSAHQGAVGVRKYANRGTVRPRVR